MDEIKSQIEYSELLAAKVLGSLTEDQKKELEAFEKKLHHQKLVHEILDADAFEKWTQKIDGVDTEKEWSSFLVKMEQKPEKRSRVVVMRAVKWTAAAAAIFLVGFVLFSVFQTSGIDQGYESVENANIQPGSSHAELVLSDGEVVDLETESKDKISQGTVTAENINGTLQYSDIEKKSAIEVKKNTLRVPRGAEYQLVLSDGTKVWLNAETELTYPVSFTGGKRRVELKGEAYFDVAPDEEVPFVVTSRNQEVTVLGTEFNISAYEADNTITTTLVEGKVKVNADESDVAEYLVPDQQVVFNTNTAFMEKSNVDVYPYIAWKEGRFVFNNVTLEQFLSKVARWYDVEVIFNDDSIKNIRFTGDLPRYNNMTSILKIIETEMSVHIQIKDNKKVYVSDK
ncbi:FecR family protein [Zhouia amylolytica]|uniref:FecR family protein n=1 Tax=Zhouia amylolytica TaxID=376730 RepID=A0A1I6VGH2_9FLAO|nr:FecR domain-containing protein [Zhouia amylolytica]SFT12760.1 FecR family protein [Zhouia amylolytica]